MISHTEENYLKAIFKISEKQEKPVSTNSISKEILTSAASVTDMLKRLSEKKLVNYEKYKGVSLTSKGQKIATQLIRKHRLWEVFLVEKLNFSWDKVHDIAEELEHINSADLVEKLDLFLGYPKFDPHGDPIPDKKGNIVERAQISLDKLEINDAGVLVGVREHSTPFLNYLDQQELSLGVHLKVIEKFEFDESIKILLNQKNKIVLSNKVAFNLFIEKESENEKN